MSTLGRLRIVYGLTLLSASGGGLEALRERPGVRLLLGLLGAREVVQAVVVGELESDRVVAVGVGVDATHALTMLLAATSRRHRRAALASACVAALFSAAGAARLRDRRRQSGCSTSDRPEGISNQDRG